MFGPLAGKIRMFDSIFISETIVACSSQCTLVTMQIEFQVLWLSIPTVYYLREFAFLSSHWQQKYYINILCSFWF